MSNIAYCVLHEWHRLRTRGSRALLAGILAAAVSGCATPSTPAPANPTAPAQRWPVRVREHVDLWLHGFAMMPHEAAQVPFFERGYAERFQALKNSANILTVLEGERERLAPRLASNPGMINAQFLPLYFATWEDMARSIDLTLEVEGDPRRVPDAVMARAVTVVAAYFPTAADREWLRIFMRGLRDERDRFWLTWWTQRQQELAPVLARIDTLWQDDYRPKLQGFLNNTRQATGDFLLSLPLDGEGRTLGSTSGIRVNAVTVGFPPTRERALEAIYVFAHEAVATVTTTTVEDNITPAERRDGLAAQLSGAALVRGGAILLQRVSPEIADGYARYYLEAARVPVPERNVQAALAAAFPLPQAVSDALARQIDIVLRGI